MKKPSKSIVLLDWNNVSVSDNSDNSDNSK